MPNGSPERWEKEFPKVEAFFSKISKVLEGFAISYNLMINKYYHQGADWCFLFRHHEGGVGNIVVQKCGDSYVMIYLIWWVDDYDANRRDSKHTEGKKCSLEAEVLSATLNEALYKVLSWQKEDLTRGRGNPYCNWKDEMTKEEFERQSEKYPFPKLNE